MPVPCIVTTRSRRASPPIVSNGFNAGAVTARHSGCCAKFFSMFFVAAALTCANLVTLVPRRALANDALEQARTAWTERCRLVKSVRCKWTTRSRTQKAYYLLSFGDEGLSRSKLAANQKEYLEYSEEATFSNAGQRMRFDTVGKQPRGPDGRLEPYDNQSSFDGDLSVTFTPLSRPMGRPTASILNFKRCDAVILIATQPVRWAFCADPKTSGLRFEKAPIRQDASVPNADYVLGPVPLLRGPTTTTYWLDSRQGYSIRRMLVSPPPAAFKAGAPSSSLDCEYERREPGVWVPTHWTNTRVTVDGQVLDVQECTVTQMEINPAFADDYFHIDFPPGTAITDSRPQPATGPKGTVLSIVLPNGKQRIVTWEEEQNQVPYERLIKTESGRGHLPDPPNWLVRHWLLVVNIAFGALLGVAVLVRMWTPKTARR